ncbi:hypothetical protein C1H46_012058 [Malus baccata]|uniref:Phytocyanin domain-containing protein n=1 Tax=Malus baccata TaxID=106549 RepID=A0A540MU26_MALBA|nr:hypothetical protein C1H46_012058 [Malus baccata]
MSEYKWQLRASPSVLGGHGQVFNWTETWDHNVGEIATNEEYDSCSDPGIVLGPGIRTILNSTSSRFFICTVGDHREQGQKVSITVGSPTTTSCLLAPPPPSSHASSLTTTTLRTFVGLISIFISYFISSVGDNYERGQKITLTVGFPYSLLLPLHRHHQPPVLPL